MTVALDISTIILVGVLFIYLAILVFRRRGFPGNAIIPLLFYLIICLAWISTLIVQSARPDLVTAEWLSRISAFFLVVSFGIFYAITMLVIRPGKRSRWSWLPGTVWLALLGLYDSHITALRFVPVRDLISFLPQAADVGWITIIGWIVLFFSGLVSFWRVLHSSSRANANNRVLFWFAAFVPVALGDFILLTGSWLTSSILLAAGSLVAVRVITSYHLPPIRQVIRQALGLVVIVLLTTGLLASGYWLMTTMPAFSKANGNLHMLLLAILLAITLNGLWLVTQKVVNRLMPVTHYDTNRILHECSQTISNVTTPELLATAAVGLISEAIEIRRGFLFVVDHEGSNGDGAKVIQLLPAGGMGEVPPAGSLPAASPIIEYLLSAHEPLHQHDIITSPRFTGASQHEREWFNLLDLEIYIPIFTREDWIGLVGLGAKTSGAPYFEEDILLLSTLADQMAVALQNIRLMESLTRVNNDFRRAYAAMEQSNRHLQQANQQLEKLDRTKSDFISIASHELRTPLTVMRGYNEMLMEDPKINENHYHYKLVKGIHSGILRLHEIVESMLDMASIDSRMLQLQTEPLTLNVQLCQVSESFADSLKERNIHLSIENLRDLPTVEADPEAIRKVFTQLIQNAIKYTPDGGSVNINGYHIFPGQMNFPEGGVEIIVSDTGIGIDPEYLEVIFSKFYQTGEIALHSTGRTKFKGAGPGLGLAIVKGIVEAHGGKIWAESRGYSEETCPGSLFHVLLPTRQSS